MSKYTISLKNYCENRYTNESGTPAADVPAENVINWAAPKIFNFTFPVFDEEYRDDIETLIIRHFYFREIGFETFPMFQLKLHDRMLQVMPAINEMYSATITDGNKIFDFSDGGERRTYEEETSGETSKETSGEYEKNETTADKQQISISVSDTENHKYGENDTPQNAIPQGWGNNTYLSKYEYSDDTKSHTETRQVTNISAGSDGKINNGAIFHWDNGSNSGSESGSTSGAREFLETIYKIGDSKKNLEFLAEMESKFVSIETVLLNSLESLFMQIW